MMRHYETLAELEREGFTVIVDKTWEDLDVRDCFDDSCHDIEQIIEDINSYTLDWFMLRVRVLLDGHELGSHYLGGCLYKDAREVLTDGTAEDCIAEAIHEAKRAVYPLMRKLQVINEEIEREGVTA
jgi:GH15 family glucan-1,4-alpha-glucosidase